MKKRTAAGLWAVLGCGLVLMGTTACNHTKTSPTATPTLGAEDSEATVIRLEQEYAEAYGYAGRLARVEWHVRDYLDDHPDDPRALALLAEVLHGMDADAEALTVARRCIRVREDSPACWWTVAVLEEARHGTVEAREGYTMYLEHAPQGVHAVDARTSLQRLAATSTAGPAQAVAELDAHDHRVTAKPPL